MVTYGRSTDYASEAKEAAHQGARTTLSTSRCAEATQRLRHPATRRSSPRAGRNASGLAVRKTLPINTGSAHHRSRRERQARRLLEIPRLVPVTHLSEKSVNGA